MKTFLRFLLKLFFRFRALNEEALRGPGPMLLTPNHVSWFDWLFLAVCLDDNWRFVTSSHTAQTSWLHRKLMTGKHAFPVETDSPYAVKRMAEYLQSGGKLVLFPEGRLSQTGSLMKLFDGTGFLLYKTGAKVVTCYLRDAYRLPLSPQPGWKKLFPKVSAHFSEVLTPPKPENVSTTIARQKVTNWLRDKLVEQQFWTEMEFGPTNVLAAVAQTAQLRPKHVVLEDVTRQKLTYRKLFVGVDLFARQLRGILNNEKRTGVLLPNVNAMPVTLLSLWAIEKVPAILNYSTGAATMLSCVQLAGLKQIITSRTFIEKGKLNLQPLSDAGIQFLYLEDIRAEISSTGKFFALLKTCFSSSFTDFKSQPDGTAVVLFTSGSEGIPKGVELTHKNLLANIRQMLAVTDLVDSDRFFNALPLFHSFGLSVGTLLPLVRGLYVFVYPSPLHYRVVPTVFYDLNCTVMFGTNTFLNGYARKAHAYDFRSLRYLFAAAEKLQEATANTWARRFGVRILEGYGATECSPALTVNTLLTPSHGSAGKFLPGVEYKLEAVEGVETGGRLFVRGSNVMRGYLNQDANEKFKALNGWYDTGDIVSVDENGFVQILGRLKRFAKVSGEMVSLTAVEDALAGAFPQYGLRCQVAVVSQPDEDKGEKLIAVTNEPKLQLDEIRAAIKAKGLTNLCVPREIKTVREIPKLGTGKVNHRELQKILADR
jgi:acyl-[acyl-carrier-protein]-phospholipid O-acyltransferase / long-chain-fatty-acid--[acyl-carrier-protein] ligase